MVALVARLKEFLDYKGIGVIELADALGYTSPQKLYRLFNTKNAWPSCQIIEDLGNAYEELNLNWLFAGRGSMIISLEDQSDFKEKYYQCLEEKSWMAIKCIEDKDKYEELLLKVNIPSEEREQQQ